MDGNLILAFSVLVSSPSNIQKETKSYHVKFKTRTRTFDSTINLWVNMNTSYNVHTFPLVNYTYTRLAKNKLRCKHFYV